MMWYGFIYYLLFNFILLLFYFFYLKIQLLSTTNQYKYLINYNNLFIYTVLYLFLITLLMINYFHRDILNLFYFSSTYNILCNTSTPTITYFFYSEDTFLNILQIYYYPYIYIFILITSLSIIYTLTYSINEFKDFMYYLILITIAGLILFFSNSIILFFMAYETLLIPSFFILYKYAKTKRSVEAAYLMFF